MNIHIGKPIVVNDMQGPCPTGFHVPTNSEWTSMISAMRSMNAISSDSYSGLYQYLLLYGNSGRSQSDGSIRTISESAYWTSTAKDSGAAAYSYRFSSSYYYEMGYYTNMGLSIRPFKDTPVEPDSTWTRTYYRGNGSIWRNTDLGLISLTSDGTTWITISDKNAGATQPCEYQSGKTAEKVGGYYQWGNNYMFPYSGSITTTSTRVNASTYGPINPYSSSNFILGSSGNYGWDTSYNKNLRGGESQGTSIKSIEVQNIYIGEYAGEPITTAGIYWDETQGLISISSNGSTWITISDKNLGATEVYNDGDTLTEEKTGYYYQWGNNYPFPKTGSVTTSSTLVGDVSSYGPGNYYYSSTFVTGAYNTNTNWSSTFNANLWGDTTNTNEARRGPCPEGYHIMSFEELQNLITVLKTGLSLSNSAINPLLKISNQGYRSETNGTASEYPVQYLWTTKAFLSSTQYLARTTYTHSDNWSYGTSFLVKGQPIRPFKNTPVQPTSKWTKLY